MIKVGLYVDGFNMYHALDDLKKPHVKWLNLWALGETLLGKDETLAKVVFCSAVRTDDKAKMLRHRAYLKALKSAGVECLMGHFIEEDRTCRSCGCLWKAPVEKQGDVSLALAVIDDAYRKVCDKALLLTADSDQAVTISLYRRRFPNQTIISVAPPGKYHHPRLRDSASGHAKIETSSLLGCLFPALAGPPAEPIKRPAEYAPPEQRK